MESTQASAVRRERSRTSRASFISLALLGAALAMCAILGSCSNASAAVESASRLSFPPAFSEDYLIAQEAISSRADDAKLLAVQSTTYAQAGVPAEWIFLFSSWQRASSYTVTVANGQATVADNPTISLSQEAFDAMPDPKTIALDAEDAWSRVVEQLEDNGRYLTARAYLTVSASENDDPGNEAPAWIFTLNDPNDFRGSFLDTSDEIAPLATFAVDAISGEVTEVS